MRKQGGALRAVHFANYGYQRVMRNLQTIGDICFFFAKNLTKVPKQYAESAFELLFPIAEMAKHDSEQAFFRSLATRYQNVNEKKCKNVVFDGNKPKFYGGKSCIVARDVMESLVSV